jgi:formate/nitrite transporter FocA (FNT family)
MSEPTLESIDDYNTLRGEKKKVVWAVIIAGLVMGIVYAVTVSFYNNEEPTSIEKTYKKVPMR